MIYLLLLDCFLKEIFLFQSKVNAHKSLVLIVNIFDKQCLKLKCIMNLISKVNKYIKQIGVKKL